MRESVGLVNWNTPTNQTLVAIAVIFAVLLVAATTIEYVRQRRMRSRRTAAAWQLLESIEKEKDFTDEERRLLHALIRRWAPDDPHRVATLRHHFDSCVEKEMESLRQQGDMARYEKVGVLLRDIRFRLALDFVPIGQQIFSTRELYPGQEVWFTRESDSPPRWIRGVINTVNEAYIHAAPTEGFEPGRPQFQAGDAFRFRLYRDEDARYMFTSTFVRKDSEPLALVFLHTSKQKRIQSREHFRVRHEQVTNVGVMNAPLDTASPTTRDRRIITRLRGQISNVSAGGFALVVPQPIPAQVLIRVTLEFELEAMEPFEVDARIVGTTPLPGGRCLVRTSYYDLDNERRDMVARYVMHRQRPHHETAKSAE